MAVVLYSNERNHMPIEKIPFDIETGPRDYEDVIRFVPDEILNREIRPDGRLTDPAKIKADIHKKELERAKDIDDFISNKAALSAVMGQVATIGFKFPHKAEPEIWEGDEKDLLTRFWDLYHGRDKNMYLVGWNSEKFDMPFLWQRSVMLGVKHGVAWNNRYWDSHIDHMTVFTRGVYGQFVSLANAALAMGIGAKTGSGKDFYKLYTNPETKQKAIEYAMNDIILTGKISDALVQ